MLHHLQHRAHSTRPGCKSDFEVLARDTVVRQRVAIGAPVLLALPDGKPSWTFGGIVPVPGKVPLYLETTPTTPAIGEGENTVGAMISDGRRRIVFIPGCAGMTDALARRLQGADVVLFDGTLWTDDEMSAPAWRKTGLRMGHMSVSGPNGTSGRLQAHRCRTESSAAHQQLQPDPAAIIHLNGQRSGRPDGSRLRRHGDPVMTGEILSSDELEAALRQIGRRAITRSIRSIS